MGRVYFIWLYFAGGRRRIQNKDRQDKWVNVYVISVQKVSTTNKSYTVTSSFVSSWSL
jgi:hypothetical protein